MKHFRLIDRATISLGLILLVLSAGQAHAGKIMLPDGSQCEGESVSGTLSGKATCNYANKDRYVGSFSNGQFAGTGVIVASGNRCEGQFAAGELNRQATCKYKSGKQFVGEFKNGEKEGKGVLIYANGTKVDGNWKAGKQQ